MLLLRFSVVLLRAYLYSEYRDVVIISIIVLRVGNSFIPLKSYPFPRSFTKRSHYSQISITRASVIQIFQLSGRSFLVSSFLNIYIHLFIFIFSIIRILDYPEYQAQSSRVRIIKVRPYMPSETTSLIFPQK